MDEREALSMLAATLPGAGDDAAVVDGTVVSTDMLHETTDFPDGTTRYTAGWRSVGASLSDVAAMGAAATVAVAAYGAPTLERAEIEAFVDGARDVCAAVDAQYVGGDLDEHGEFTAATTALGTVEDPVYRSGATPGDVVCVTGTLGRTGAAVRRFREGDTERGNDLFRFKPRVAAGRALASHASAMLDSSDGLARSVHQIADASDCGVALSWADLPVDESVDAVAETAADRRELATFFGEDFELVCTVPADAVDAAREACPVALTPVGSVVPAAEGVTADGDPLPDRGFVHGEDTGRDR
jgi:thiamine-monophosphate kinase